VDVTVASQPGATALSIGVVARDSDIMGHRCDVSHVDDLDVFRLDVLKRVDDDFN
jgi:hypothetical protein